MKSPPLISINCIIAIQLLIIAVLLSPPAASQPSPSPPLWVSYRPSTNYSTMNPRVGLVVLVATVVIFFTAFLCIFARSCCIDESSNSVARRLSTVRRGNRGLNSDVIDTFPTFDYSAVKALKIGKGALECAVCLSEFEDDESLRLIPKCDHLFHADCIDLWLASHATCPVCRAYLVPDPGEPVNADSQAGAGNQNDDVAIDVVASQSGAIACESMERPLNPPRLIRSRTRGSINRWSSASGRRRWFGLFARSYSTGHVAVASENTERFTLRVPEEVRRQIISGKLSRTTSCVAPSPTEGSSRRGNLRIGLGSGQALNY